MHTLPFWCTLHLFLPCFVQPPSFSRDQQSCLYSVIVNIAWFKFIHRSPTMTSPRLFRLDQEIKYSVISPIWLKSFASPPVITEESEGPPGGSDPERVPPSVAQFISDKKITTLRSSRSFDWTDRKWLFDCPRRTHMQISPPTPPPPPSTISLLSCCFEGLHWQKSWLFCF